jgi:hypothetical protein
MYEGENTIQQQRMGKDENNIKKILKCTMDSSASGHVIKTGCCEQGDESSSLKLKLNSVALVRELTIPTERPPPVGQVSANFCG